MNMKQLLVPINDAAKAIGAGRTKTYALVSRGKLKLVKLDGKSLITAASIEALVAELIGSTENDK
jgi:hypothetical protein